MTKDELIEELQRMLIGAMDAADSNRIRDFVDFAGNRPVNRYRYSDFQSLANLLARLPANYMKDPQPNWNH